MPSKQLFDSGTLRSMLPNLQCGSSVCTVAATVRIRENCATFWPQIHSGQSFMGTSLKYHIKADWARNAGVSRVNLRLRELMHEATT